MIKRIAYRVPAEKVDQQDSVNGEDEGDPQDGGSQKERETKRIAKRTRRKERPRIERPVEGSELVTTGQSDLRTVLHDGGSVVWVRGTLRRADSNHV